MEEVMTDLQFKSIIRMILSILKKAESKEEAIEELEKLLEE